MPRDDDNDDVQNEDAPNEREMQRDAATPGGQQRNRRARNGRPASVNARTGVGFFPDGTTLPNEAELAWPVILEQVEANGMSPYDVRIQVVQTDPPSPNGDLVSVGQPISGGSIQGSTTEPAGAALVRYVTDWYHMPRSASQGTVKYQLRFSVGNRSVARAYLTLGPREEILALRRADTMRRQQEGQQPPPYAPPSGFGAAPMPPMQQQPQGFAAPPQSGSPSVMEMFHMMREMMSLGQQVPPQMLDFMARGFGQPPPAAPPPPPPVNEDAIVQKTTAAVVQTLAQLGVIQIPQPGVVQPQVAAAGVAAPVQTAPKSAMERAFERVMDAAVTQFVGGVEKTIKATITGVGAPPPAETPVNETPEPEKPPELPWKAMAVPGANWANGSPVHYAEDTETGGISLQGFVMNNPVILEKGFEKVTELAGAVGEALKRIGKPPQPQQQPQQMQQAEVVKEIPATATDATPKTEWK